MTDALKPLAAKDGDPIFEQAWQAEALGIADLLVQQGVFSSTDWAETLGSALRTAPDTTEGYYTAVLKSLEHLLAQNGVAMSELDAMQTAWTDAYRSTPHGQPVTLGSAD
ncbi:MAG: nitrile hydratase accessory protein [Pseudomonadota bacterium]